MDSRPGGWIPEVLRKALERNLRRLMQEIRETGELSVLLTRAARGQSLTPEERKRMRAQLIDVAKAIPALAIFAAPGGVLLLIVLAKVLPFSLLPSAFTDEEEDEAGPKEAPPIAVEQGRGVAPTAPTAAEQRHDASPSAAEQGHGSLSAAEPRREGSPSATGHGENEARAAAEANESGRK